MPGSVSALRSLAPASAVPRQSRCAPRAGLGALATAGVAVRCPAFFSCRRGSTGPHPAPPGLPPACPGPPEHCRAPWRQPPSSWSCTATCWTTGWWLALTPRWAGRTSGPWRSVRAPWRSSGGWVARGGGGQGAAVACVGRLRDAGRCESGSEVVGAWLGSVRALGVLVASGVAPSLPSFFSPHPACSRGEAILVQRYISTRPMFTNLKELQATAASQARGQGRGLRRVAHCLRPLRAAPAGPCRMPPPALTPAPPLVAVGGGSGGSSRAGCGHPRL